MKKIYIIGLGMRGLDQLTAEADIILSGCTTIFNHSENYKSLKKRYNNVIDLDEDYWKSSDFHCHYKETIKLVIREASDGGRVGITTYGHPLLYDDVTLGIMREAKRKKIKVVVVPGISCLDTISVDLGIDYGHGIQVIDAESMVYDRIKPSRQIDLLLFQIGVFGIESPGEVDYCMPERLKPLIRYLSKYYGPDHKVRIVYSHEGDNKGINKSTKIKNLPKNEKLLVVGSSLYIPKVD